MPISEIAVETGQRFVDPSNPAPLPTFGVAVVDSQTVTAFVNQFLAAPGLYDVRLINGDGQVTAIEQALQLVFQ